jgi:hypothetical protein
MGTDRRSEVCIYYQVPLNQLCHLKNIGLFHNLVVCFKDLHIVLNFILYDPRVEAPKRKVRYLYNLSS